MVSLYHDVAAAVKMFFDEKETVPGRTASWDTSPKKRTLKLHLFICLLVPFYPVVGIRLGIGILRL